MAVLPPLVPQTVSYVSNGISSDVCQVQTYFRNQGVSMPPYFQYNVIPNATNTTSVALSQAIQAGTPMTLVSAGAIAFLGNSGVVVLDCFRPLLFTLSGAVGAGNFTVTVRGWDNRNVAVTASKTINTATGTSFFIQKSFSLIRDIVWTTTPGVNVSVGIGQQIGLPFYMPLIQYFADTSWNSADFDIYANFNGPTANFISPNDWRVEYAGDPYPNHVLPNATSKDARGIIQLNGAGTGQDPNGTSMFSANLYVYGADSYLQAQLQNNVVSAQKQVGGILELTSPFTPFPMNQSAPPTLVSADEVGWQYPGDNSYNPPNPLPNF